MGQPDVMAPVPGFCESLLSMTCAPNVTGVGSSHGPCLVTDQNIFKERSVMLYGDGELFDGMYDSSGKRQSMTAWGEPNARLRNTRTWENEPNLNLFRRVCTQMYQPRGTLDKRIVDPSLGLTMYAAPFSCPRKDLFQAVFGKAGQNFNDWSTKLDLRNPEIVAALDSCHNSYVSAGPAPAPALVDSAPAPADRQEPQVPAGVRPQGDVDSRPSSFTVGADVDYSDSADSSKPIRRFRQIVRHGKHREVSRHWEDAS